MAARPPVPETNDRETVAPALRLWVLALRRALASLFPTHRAAEPEPQRARRRQNLGGPHLSEIVFPAWLSLRSKHRPTRPPMLRSVQRLYPPLRRRRTRCPMVAGPSSCGCSLRWRSLRWRLMPRRSPHAHLPRAMAFALSPNARSEPGEQPPLWTIRAGGKPECAQLVAPRRLVGMTLCPAFGAVALGAQTVPSASGVR